MGIDRATGPVEANFQGAKIKNSVIQVGNANTMSTYRPPLRGRDSPLAVTTDPHFEERVAWRAKIDEYRQTPQGYILLEGRGGVGKTTFLKNLVVTEQLAAGFTETEMRVGESVLELAYRLVDRWDIPRPLADEVSLALSGNIADGRVASALERALAAAAAQAKQPVVVVLDGFSSLGPPLDEFLPRSLPTGVCAIVGQRSGTARGGLHDVRLVDTHEHENPGELRRWILKLTSADPLHEMLNSAGVNAADFAEMLAAKAGTVWVYAKYVLADVRTGRLNPSAVAELPGDLWSYFRQFFGVWEEEHPDTWHQRDLPALGMLGTVTDDLAVGRLAELIADGSAPPDPEALYRLFGRDWIAFLAHPQPDVFKCYHPSLREFLSGIAPSSSSNAEDDAFRAQLARSAAHAHIRLGQYYQDELETDEDQPGLSRATLRAKAAHHFVSAASLDHLDSLLIDHTGPLIDFDDRTRPRNHAFDDFGRDGVIGTYREICAEALEVAFNENHSPSSASRVIRYGAIVSSMSSMTAGLPLGLLRAAMTCGIWTPQEILRQIAANDADDARARKLAALIPHMSGVALNQGACMLAAAAHSPSVTELLHTMHHRLAEFERETLEALLESLDIRDLERVCTIFANDSPERARLIVRRVLDDGQWSDSHGRVVRECVQLTEEKSRWWAATEIEDSKLSATDKPHALAEALPLLPPGPSRTELALWIFDELTLASSSYSFRYELSRFDAVTLGRVSTVYIDALEYERPPSPVSVAHRVRPLLPVRRLWRDRRQERLSRSTPRRRAIPADPAWIARARLAAAVASTKPDEGSEAARRALAAILQIKDRYERGDLLGMLAKGAKRHVDIDTCLAQLHRLPLDDAEAVVEALLPRLDDAQCAGLLRWACRPNLPRKGIIDLLLPRLSKDELERLLERVWPDEPEHHIVARHRSVLQHCDNALVEQYMTRHMPAPGERLDYMAASRLEAVCAAPKAGVFHVTTCVQLAVDDYTASRQPYGFRVLHGHLLRTALPRLPPGDLTQVAHQLNLFVDRPHLAARGVLTAIANVLPPSFFPRVLDIARIAEPSRREQLLDAIAPRLPRDLLLEAIDVARQVEEDCWSGYLDSVALAVQHASDDARRTVAHLSWPFRRESPGSLRKSGFACAAEGLPTADRLLMLDALDRQFDRNPSDRTSDDYYAAESVLLAALENSSPGVVARCVELTLKHCLIPHAGTSRYHRTLPQQLLRLSDSRERRQIVDHILDLVQTREALADSRVASAFAEVLPFLSNEKFYREVDSYGGASPRRPDAPTEVLVGFVRAWPDDDLGQVKRLLPAARAAIAFHDAKIAVRSADKDRIEDVKDAEMRRSAFWRADYGDSDWSILRAIADRSDDALRQELIDEFIVHFHRPSRTGSEPTLIDTVGVRPSVQTAARLRAATLADGHPAPDYLIDSLVTALPTGEVIIMMRDDLEATPQRLVDACAMIERLQQRPDKPRTDEMLALVENSTEEIAFARLARVLAPLLTSTQAGHLLDKLDPTESLFLGAADPRSDLVLAFEALTTRLGSGEATRAIDKLLEQASSRGRRELPYRFPMLRATDAEPISRLISRSSARGHAAATDIATSLGWESGAAVYLAVARASNDADLSAKCVERATEKLNGQPPSLSMVRLLSEAALASPAEASRRIMDQAFATAASCAWDNDQSAALLHVAKNAPSLAAKALTLAILVYKRDLVSTWTWHGDAFGDPLLFELETAVSNLDQTSAARVAADVAYECRNRPRQEFLMRLAIVLGGAAKTLGPRWASDVAEDLTFVRTWWP